MTPKDYRKQVEREIAAATRRRDSASGFRDASKSATARRRALTAAARIEAAEDVAAARTLVAEKGADASLRAAAIEALGPDDQTLMAQLVDTIRDVTEPLPVRRAALLTLQRASFMVVQFAPIRPSYLAAVRSIIRDPDEALRTRALEILAAEHDGEAQRALLDGLRNPAQALVPPVTALQLLSYDIHAEHYPIVRSLIASTSDPAVKVAALRILAADAGSRDQFAKLLRDKNESPEVRQVSASALQTVDRKAFRAEARKIILDDQEDQHVSATLMTGLAHFGEGDSLSKDKALQARVTKLGKGAKSAAVKQSARTLAAKRP